MKLPRGLTNFHNPKHGIFANEKCRNCQNRRYCTAFTGVNEGVCVTAHFYSKIMELFARPSSSYTALDFALKHFSLLLILLVVCWYRLIEENHRRYFIFRVIIFTE